MIGNQKSGNDLDEVGNDFIELNFIGFMQVSSGNIKSRKYFAKCVADNL